MANDFLAGLPSEFVTNAIRVCGLAGREWLQKIPACIAECERSWGINVDPHFPLLTYNYVAPASLKNGGEAVLKLGLPLDEPEIYGEAAYLRHVNGNGSVKLLAESRPNRAILIERVYPGSRLKEVFELDHRSAVYAAVDLLKKLECKAPADGQFVTFSTWYDEFYNVGPPEFPRRFVEKAVAVFESSNGPNDQLLHGDFHHDNILAAGDDTFKIIDPKGVIGNIKYEAAVFLHNHHRWLTGDRPEDLIEAAAIFAEALGCSIEEIRSWVFAQIILSNYWTCMEGGDSWIEELALAEFWDV